MSHIFYLFGIIYLIRELIDLVTPFKYTRNMEWFFQFAEDQKTDKVKSFSDLTADQRGVLMHALFSMIAIVWAGIGLLTANWVIFAAFLVFGFVIYSPLSKLIRKVFGFGKAYAMLHIFGTIVDILLVGFAIINQYHLKIDVLKLFIN